MREGDQADFAERATEADDRSLLEDLGALVNDGRVAIEAEVSFQKTRLGYSVGIGRAIAIYGGAALFLAWFFLVALTVGLLLALTPEVGPWAALAIVAGVLLIAAALCGLVAMRNVKRLVAAFKADKP